MDVAAQYFNNIFVLFSQQKIKYELELEMRKIMFEFEKELRERILVLDGAMGTVLQKYELSAEDFNGAKGCYEILNETRPDIIFVIIKF